MIVFGAWYGLCYALVNKDRGEHIDLGFMVLMLALFYLCMFVLPWWIRRKEGKYALILKAVGPTFVTIMNCFRDGENSTLMYGFLAMINYDLTFMAQGLID